MKNKRFISLILAFVLIFTIATPCMARDVNYTGGTMQIYDGDVVQDEFTINRTAAYYKVVATDNLYYNFSFENQSVEARTGISIADKFLNLFLGKINIQITDQYEKILSDFTVKCGYKGNVSLKLEKNSTYYIKVTSNVDGFYRLKVKTYTDIGGNTWDTATESLSVGQFISSIDANGDKEWYYFETDDTDSFYDFNLENISGSSYLYMYVYEYVEGAGQIPLRDTFDISAWKSETKSKQLKLKPNSKYYVCIYLNSGIGGYQLDIDQTLDAVGDTMDNAYKVDLDTKVTTALDGKGDVDFFKFTTKDYDAYYYFDMGNLSIDNDYSLYVYDAQGNEIGHSRKYGTSGVHINYKLDPNTEYYFKIYAHNDAIGNYNFTISDIVDAHANEQKNATQIRLEQEVSAAVSGANDVDFFKFITEDFSAYYYFDMNNLSIDNDYSLYVYDAQGNEIGYSRKYGTSGVHINFNLEPGAEYYFKIYAHNSATGNYKVKVTSQKDNYPNTQEEAKNISLNQEISEAINGAGDVDFFKFTTEDVLAYYYFDMENLSINNDYSLYVYDAQGNEINYSRKYGTSGVHINSKLEPNTEYYFKIYAHNNATGNYKVKVSYVADTEGDIKEEASIVSLNKPLTRQLSSNSDVDWFKFTLNYDSNVRFVLTNESGNGKDIYVYSAIEKQLVHKYCSSDIQQTAILDAGDYYVKIKGNSGYYTFAVGDCGSAHIEKYRYVKATDKADGIKTTYCSSCGSIIKKEVIPRIDKVSLSYTKTTYSGSTKKPSVMVYDIKGDKISSSQYDVKYSSGLKNVGTYSVKITFKGKYSGIKTLSFKIVAQSYSKLKVKLSASNYHYNGKSKKPAVSVKDSKGKTISSAYYTIYRPTSSKNVGKYKVKIVFKGNYTGTKHLYFNVNPAKSAVTKLTAGTKKLTVKLAKSSSGSGYQIQYSTSKSFKSAKTKTVKSNKTTTVTLKSLKAKKTYYVRVRSYKKVSGQTYYSSWSSYKSKKTKK